jgi:hypothetical protein
MDDSPARTPEGLEEDASRSGLISRLALIDVCMLASISSGVTWLVLTQLTSIDHIAAALLTTVAAAMTFVQINRRR